MAWRRPGDKPLSKPMMVSLPTYICVTRPQWVNAGKRLLPEISKYKFGRQLRPTNTFARRSFRAIPGNRANGVVKACLATINSWLIISVCFEGYHVIFINIYQSRKHPICFHPFDGVCWSVIALEGAPLKSIVWLNRVDVQYNVITYYNYLFFFWMPYFIISVRWTPDMPHHPLWLCLSVSGTLKGTQVKPCTLKRMNLSYAL